MEKKPLIGALVVYAPIRLSAPDPARDPRLGHVVPLRLGDVVLLGRKKSQGVNIGDRMLPITEHVLFPDKGTYLSISREHLVVEPLPEGVTRVVDVSSAGHFALERGAYVKGARGRPVTVDYEGSEMLYLACERLEHDTSTTSLAAASGNRIQLIRFDANGNGSP